MAVFVDLTVECASEAAALRVLRHFEGFELRVGGLSVPMARSEVIAQNERWYFRAAPAGLGHNSASFAAELNTPASMATILGAFYDHLKGVSGFRRALFGHEAFDALAGWGGSWDGERIGWKDMIAAAELVSDPAIEAHAAPFSPGYCRITRTLPVHTA